MFPFPIEYAFLLWTIFHNGECGDRACILKRKNICTNKIFRGLVLEANSPDNNVGRELFTQKKTEEKTQSGPHNEANLIRFKKT